MPQSRSGGNIGLTGKHLTAPEVFQDVLASGLLATSASSLAILQAPASWSDLFLLSQPVAAAGVLLYHAANAYRLATSGRHLTAQCGHPDRRDALRRRRLGPAGIGQPDAIAGWRPHGRDARRHGPAVRGVPGHGSFVIFCFNEAVAARARPGDERAGAQVRSGRTCRCWSSRPPPSRLPGSRPSARARPWLHGPCCSG